MSHAIGLLFYSAWLDDRIRSFRGCGEITFLSLACAPADTRQSLRVRSNYIDQLRNPDVIQTHLVPTLFHILGLYDGWLKSFKLDVWAVDEHYIQCERMRPRRRF
jgi:hypothetical protein